MAAVTHPPVRRVEDEVSLRELVLLIHRRRWLLLACLFLGGIAGIGLLSIVRPVYVASTFVLIDPERRGGTAATVASVNDTLDNGALDSQVEILASRSLAQATIDALDLAHDPDFLAPIGATTDLMSHLLPASLAGAPELDPASDPVGRFLDNLVVRRSGKSHVIAISYRSHQPAQAGQDHRVLVVDRGVLDADGDLAVRQRGVVQLANPGGEPAVLVIDHQCPHHHATVARSSINVKRLVLFEDHWLCTRTGQTPGSARQGVPAGVNLATCIAEVPTPVYGTDFIPIGEEARG